MTIQTAKMLNDRPLEEEIQQLAITLSERGEKLEVVYVALCHMGALLYLPERIIKDDNGSIKTRGRTVRTITGPVGVFPSITRVEGTLGYFASPLPYDMHEVNWTAQDWHA